LGRRIESEFRSLSVRDLWEFPGTVALFHLGRPSDSKTRVMIHDWASFSAHSGDSRTSYYVTSMESFLLSSSALVLSELRS